jgi:hypothetical protein
VWGNVQQVSLLIKAPSLQYELLATTAWPYYCLTSCFTTATALLAALPLLSPAGLARINAPFLQYLLRSTHTHTHTHTTHTETSCCSTIVCLLQHYCVCFFSQYLLLLRFFARSHTPPAALLRAAASHKRRTRNLSVYPQSLCIPAISLYTRNLSVFCSLTQIYTRKTEQKRKSLFGGT